jgi:iron complex outermembrane receptor protein
MSRRSQLCAGTMLAAAFTLGLAGQAAAQAQTASSDTEVDEVVVTGSFIRGTPEDAPLPVDVITSEALKDQGSPSLVDLVRTIPSVSGGNIGESNRFLGGAAAGVATINLRGLGLTRTLSLMNGERLSTITAAGGQEFVNVNVVPTIAIGQVEVLRDGAAATYGSDAVAGVVNFITRKDLEGFEASGKYALIDGSGGDYEGSVAWGRKFDNGNMLLAASYRRRSELNGVDLPWTLPNAVFPDTVNISGSQQSRRLQRHPGDPGARAKRRVPAGPGPCGPAARRDPVGDILRRRLQPARRTLVRPERTVLLSVHLPRLPRGGGAPLPPVRRGQLRTE